MPVRPFSAVLYARFPACSSLPVHAWSAVMSRHLTASPESHEHCSTVCDQVRRPTVVTTIPECGDWQNVRSMLPLSRPWNGGDCSCRCKMSSQLERLSTFSPSRMHHRGYPMHCVYCPGGSGRHTMCNTHAADCACTHPICSFQVVLRATAFTMSMTSSGVALVLSVRRNSHMEALNVPSCFTPI